MGIGNGTNGYRCPVFVRRRRLKSEGDNWTTVCTCSLSSSTSFPPIYLPTVQPHDHTPHARLLKVGCQDVKIVEHGCGGESVRESRVYITDGAARDLARFCCELKRQHEFAFRSPVVQEVLGLLYLGVGPR